MDKQLDQDITAIKARNTQGEAALKLIRTSLNVSFNEINIFAKALDNVANSGRLLNAAVSVIGNMKTGLDLMYDGFRNGKVNLSYERLFPKSPLVQATKTRY